MSRMRVSAGKKAKPLPISLKPMHLEMLTELERMMRKNRSRVVQILIENEYKTRIKDLEENAERESW